MADIKRSAIALPAEVSSEILAKTQNQSAVMRLARQISLVKQGDNIKRISSGKITTVSAVVEAKKISKSKTYRGIIFCKVKRS